MSGGNTVEFTCDVLTNNQLSAVLYQVQPTTSTLTEITVPASSDKTNVTIHYKLPDNLTQLSLRFLQVNASSENVTYIDNLSLKII